MVYLFFSIVYWSAGATDPDGNHYIYPPLNYHHPWQVAGLIIFIILVLLPAMQLALFAWARLFERAALRRLAKLRRHQESVDDDDQAADLERPMI